MIVTALNGGLGNQMFQYAVGRQVALKLKTTLKLDVSSYKRFPKRSYRLDVFNIQAALASHWDMIRFGVLKRHERFLLPIVKMFAPHQQFHVVDEPKLFVYTPDAVQLPGNLLLKGYWQNEQYFNSIRDVLLREFTLKTLPDPRNRNVADEILEQQSVCLHIRRGDYATDPLVRQHHGLQPLAYYECAVGLMAERLTSPHLFVFSDDPEWVHTNIRFDIPFTVIDHNGPLLEHLDLWLMSQCSHHIIANSSFSWWGAWLATSNDQIVVAPLSWHNMDNVHAAGPVPDRWHRL